MMTSDISFPHCLEETQGKKDPLETQLKLWGQRGVGSAALRVYWLPSPWWHGCQRLVSRAAMPRGRDHLLRGVHAALAQCSWLLRWLPCHETYLMTRQEDPRTVPPPQSSCLRQESANAWFPLPPSALTCRRRDVGRGERLLPSRAVPCGDKSSSAVPAGRQTRHPLTVLMTAHVSAQRLLRRATPGAPGVDVSWRGKGKYWKGQSRSSTEMLLSGLGL